MGGSIARHDLVLEVHRAASSVIDSMPRWAASRIVPPGVS
jgi:hypothetical protein